MEKAIRIAGLIVLWIILLPVRILSAIFFGTIYIIGSLIFSILHYDAIWAPFNGFNGGIDGLLDWDYKNFSKKSKR